MNYVSVLFQSQSMKLLEICISLSYSSRSILCCATSICFQLRFDSIFILLLEDFSFSFLYLLCRILRFRYLVYLHVQFHSILFCHCLMSASGCMKPEYDRQDAILWYCICSETVEVCVVGQLQETIS
jgi:hypothetical protein